MSNQNQQNPRHTCIPTQNYPSVNIMISRNYRHRWGNTVHTSNSEIGYHTKKLCQTCRITQLTYRPSPGAFPINRFFDSNNKLLTQRPYCFKPEPKTNKQLDFDFFD